MSEGPWGQGLCFPASAGTPPGLILQAGIVSCKISVSPGTIEIITQAGLPTAVQPVLMCPATGVPAATPSRAASPGVGMPAH
jgi:hypothetical protein